MPTPPVPPCTPEEYDEWFHAKVQEALDDPRPSIPHDEAMIHLEGLLERRRRDRS
ncbi:addiction module antitoxin [Deltaproteobacteria bacterium Smac51]|nr:addiction module antitoxin [Deltaproteobacteria bacterium Smac51]